MPTNAAVAREAHPRDTVLFEQGAPGSTAYYIERGRVSVERDGETLAVLSEGDIVGEMALIDDRPRTATARCSDDSRFLVINRDYLQAVIARADPALPFLLRVVLRRFRGVIAPGEGLHMPELGGGAASDEDGREFASRLRLEDDLRTSLAAGRFFLVAQPIIQLNSGEAVAAETLIRLDHPDSGVLTPGQFMPLAEECGIIVEMGRWIIEEAARIASKRHGEWNFISVNVAARQLGHPELTAEVADACEQAGIRPSRLALEVTETGIVEEPENAARLLDELAALGCHIAIDDFGTGTSSFSQLHRLPFNILKIDRTLIAALTESNRARKMVRAINRMADELGQITVAEGIETAAQAHAAREAGCSLGQGFYFAYPTRV